MHLRKLGLSLLAAGLLLGSLAGARAQTSDTLQNLINGNSLSINGYTFDNFSAGSGSTFPSPLYSDIMVNVFSSSANQVGIRFDANPAWTAPNQQGFTMPWEFDLHAPVGLSTVTLTSDASGDPTSDADVHKRISDLNGSGLLAIADNFIGHTSDTQNFAHSASDLHILEHVDVANSGVGTAPSVSFVQQDFAQQGFTVTPEGNSLAMIGLGALPLIGFGVRRLRRRK